MQHAQSQQHSSSESSPLFMGLDLSTQQLKVIVLEQDTSSSHDQTHENLHAHSLFSIHFDSELPRYHTRGGVCAHDLQEKERKEERQTVTPDKDNDKDKGVVTVPVLMWVEALERVLDKMKAAQFPFHRVVSISGAAQQHGSVYWSSHATGAFSTLQTPKQHSSSSGLVEIFKDAFTVAQSPIWQDTSTAMQCEEIEMFLGNLEYQRRSHQSNLYSNDNMTPITTTTTNAVTAAPLATANAGTKNVYRDKNKEKSTIRLLGQERLAELTGSRAYERYTASQILKIVQRSPEIYHSTTRISLISSFLASVLIAGYASIDVADGSGMNLLDIRTKTWDPVLTWFVDQGGRVNLSQVELAKNGMNALKDKLGEVDATGKKVQGRLCDWFVERYGFSKDVNIVTFTGDNPATVMALHAEQGDAIVSLGTSDTLLLYTHVTPSIIDESTDTTSADERLSVGYLCHPVDPKGYLMLYCAINGSLAREQIRNLYAGSNWDQFNQFLKEGMNTGIDVNGTKNEMIERMGFYFFDREIWPPVQGVYRFENGTLVDEFGSHDAESVRRENAVALCESQFMAMRIRSSQNGTATSPQLSSTSLNPPGIARILATGGASSNQILLQLLANIFGVPVVSMGGDDQQPGAGSAGWGAARKAYLYGKGDEKVAVCDEKAVDCYSGEEDNRVAILPNLTQTKKYVDRISEFLRLEASLL
ncbi:hypothetical protein FBU30_006778 [Linnemannia zychae]|nr:hypothetical protein FBU30_006778 [Linnemannia zychae]